MIVLSWVSLSTFVVVLRLEFMSYNANDIDIVP